MPRWRLSRAGLIRALTVLATALAALALSLPIGQESPLFIAIAIGAAIFITYLQARLVGTVGAERARADASRRELEDSYMATITALAASIYAKDRQTESHSRGTAALAVAVGHRMGLTGEELRLLEYAALLHDIGKIGLPGYVLNKPGPLTPDEITLMREHPLIAERILSSVPFLKPVSPVIRAQNEQWDGSGYPDGLSGTAIPIAARILHACAAFHAMAAERAYRPALSRDEILHELRAQAGKQFDPVVVETLTQVVESEEVGAVSASGGHAAQDRAQAPREWLQHLATIEGLGRRLPGARDLAEIMAMVGEAVDSLVPNDQARVLLRSPEGVFLDAVYISPSRRPDYQGIRAEDLRTKVGAGISGWVVLTGRGVVIDDAERDPRAVHVPGTPVIGESMVAAPILGAQGPVGVLVVVSAGRRRYGQEDLRLLMVVANQLGATLAALRPHDRAA